MIETLQSVIAKYHYLVLPFVVVISYFSYRLFRFIFGRLAYFIIFRTKGVYDDLIVDRLHPFRIAWIVPLLLFYFTSDIFFQQNKYIKNILLFFSIWILIDFLIALLRGINDIYKHRPGDTGIGASAYIDLVKIVLIITAIILSISIFVQLSPLVLLSGVGAWLAVLMLIFKDTILSFLACLRIASQKSIKNGDWIEVPGYQADGIVYDMNLYSIMVKNWDKTFSLIPTNKVVEVGFKNWRGMEEDKGRRFIKHLVLDITSIKICDMALLEKLMVNSITSGLLKDTLTELQDGKAPDSSLLTNIQLFMQYTKAYLQKRKDLQKHSRFLKIVIIKEITQTGVTVQILWFAKATDKAPYEATVTDILLHLLAVLPHFDLRLYQKPSSFDLKACVKDGQIGNGTELIQTEKG